MSAFKKISAAELSEEEMWIEKSKRNPAHFEFIYNKYFNAVFRFVYQRMDSKETTADITSQVFLKALLSIHKFTFKGLPFFAWLCRIAISEIGNYYERSRKYRVINIESSGLHEMAENLETDFSESQFEMIKKALHNLSEPEMLLIEMRFFESRSYKEIGEILAITENNAKVKVYRILDKIKKHLYEKV